jgi:hypothetical protein
MYGAVIEKNQIRNGVRLEGSGDSNHIRENIISGSGIGVYASLVSGASLLTIRDNNITTDSGAVALDAGSRFRISGNNMEQTVPTTGQTSMISIQGANGTMVMGEIVGNHLGAFSGSGILQNILLQNCLGTFVQGNTILNATTGTPKGISIDATASSTRIGYNSYGSGIAVANRVFDSGVGTMGIVKAATLLNAWINFNASFYETAGYYKDIDGVVHLKGVISSGTTTSGTPLFTLPADYRPALIRQYLCANDSAGTAVFGEVRIDNATGNVTIQRGANTYLSLDGISFVSATAGAFPSDL